MSVAAAVRKGKRLWALHLVGNVALVVAIYEWLWIPDRTAPHVALTVIAGVAIATLALWLHGGTLAYFRLAHRAEAQATLAAAFRAAARRLPALAVWAIIVAMVSWMILQLLTYQNPVSNTVASWLTFGLRRPIAPANVAWIYAWLVWFAAWIKWPFLLLPWAESAASKGFAAFRWENLKRPARTALRPRYWLSCLGVFAIGVIVPYLLIQWTPPVAGIPAETASLIIRFLIAYLAAVAAWLLMASTLAVLNER